jgi:peptidoglycan-N-acetylglucosamine deacetylase
MGQEMPPTKTRRWKIAAGVFAVCLAFALAGYVAAGADFSGANAPAGSLSVAAGPATVTSMPAVTSSSTTTRSSTTTTTGPSSTATASAGNSAVVPTSIPGPVSTVAGSGTTTGSTATAGSSTTAGGGGPASPSSPGTSKAGRKLVALTFDDGPSKYTAQVVSVLQREKVPGTFFFIGRHVAGYPGIVSRMRAEGFEIENHTWSHPALTSLSKDGVLEQIRRADNVLGKVKYVRPPACKFNAAVISDVHSMGLKLALWNVDTLDWLHRSVNSIMSYLKSEVKPGAIVLMHDGGGDRSQTVAALPVVIKWLRSQGYTFVRVDQLGSAARRGTLR